MPYSVYVNGIKRNLFLSNTLVSVITSPKTKVDINKIPFISTYHYNGKLEQNESLAIEYYVTDALQSEIMIGEAIKTFNIEICIGKNQTVLSTYNYTDILAGDSSVIIHLQLSEGDYWYSIQATDEFGRKSAIIYNDFMVYNKVAYESAISNNTYEVTEADLITYNISNKGDYGSSVLVKVPSEVTDIPSYLQYYAEDIPVENDKYICFLADSNGDGYPEYVTKNIFTWTEGDYHSYVKYGSSFNAEDVEREAQNNVAGLQSLIDDKIADGYKKVILPKGTYRISSDDYISVEADNFVLDGNGCVLKSNCIKTNEYFIIMSLHGYNSKVINCNFEGCMWETDYSKWKDEDKARSYFEIGHGITQGMNSRYSGYENCTVKNITGYGIGGSTVPKNTQPIYGNTVWKWNNKFTTMPTLSDESLWKPFDIVDGVNVECDCRLTYDSYIDVSPFNASPIVSINKYLGYGDRSGGSWNLTIHFYDSGKNYIGNAVTSQFRDVILKENTKYVKITAHTTQIDYDSEDDSKNDTNRLVNLRILTPYRINNCYLKNVIVEEVRCVGMCPYGKNCYSDNVSITRCGFAEAHQLVDAEDTWEGLQDYTFRNCTINNGIQNSHLLLCSGINTTIENSDIDIFTYDRVKDLCIRDCEIAYFDVETTSFLRSGYARVYRNNFYNVNAFANGFANSMGCFEYDQNEYDKKLIIDNNNTFATGIIGADRGKHILFRNLNIDANNRQLENTVLGDYKNCVLSNFKKGFTGCRAEGCLFNNCTGIIREVYNTYFYETKFVNCKFVNCNLTYNGSKTEEELFVNCEFVTE